MEYAIRTEGLVKKFGRTTALNRLDLEVTEGAIYGFVGPNGAGKTTAIKILVNIFCPTSGRAQVLGIDSRRIAGPKLTSIGYVSENQETLEWMKVGSLLAYLRPFYPSWDRELENDLVRQLELPLDRKLKNLSRGTRMKVALAGSLAFRPKVIVLDEPFSGLDPLVRDQLIEGLLKLAKESTIFISSHDLAEIESFASHVGYLEQGKLRFSEGLVSLGTRFRAVEVTFDSPPALPEKFPETWMHPETTTSVVRFIDSRFNQEQTAAKIHELFRGISSMSFTPMSLRSIFLAMAKSGPKSA